LPYVNNVPHLGNLIGCVLSADVYARFSRQMGKNTLYICGTDEYGTATETKALEEKVTPRELCDKYHKIHKEIYDWFNIDFDYFGRTSTEVHSKITQNIFNKLSVNGLIKKQAVEQYKCHKCDLFLADRYIIGKCSHKPCTYEEARGDQCDGCGKLMNALDLIDPKCKQCKSSPSLVKSHHYYLELPSTEEKLKEWIGKASKEGSWSNNSTTITYGFLSDGLKSRCITRDLKWGVSVPTEDEEMKNKVFYVWFDAPIGYLSITANFVEKWEDWWLNPNDVKLFQFMGKDNVTFHTVIFPSTLIGTSTDYTLVHHLSTTEYLNYENKKFSKTHSTGVFGDNAKTTGIPSEVWRYYLLACRPEQSDTEFKWDDFMAKNNSELLANLGNLINRVLAFLFKYYEGKVPALTNLTDQDNKFLDVIGKKVSDYISSLSGLNNGKFDGLRIKDGLRIFMELSAEGNAYFQETEPWVSIKTDPERYTNINFRCGNVINVLINFVRLLGLLGEPYMPAFSAKLYEIINIKYDEINSTLLGRIVTVNEGAFEISKDKILSFVEAGHTINEPLPLFRKSK
jgi:methionyl-tRNA synthetase